MAHEIEDNNAFYVTKPAWHGLGHVLTDAPTIEEAWRMAYPHTLFKMDLQAVLTTDDGQTHTQALENSKVIIRDDGKEFKTVGADFELIQPYETLETFRELQDSGLCQLEAGGSLRDGSQMWALWKINGLSADILPGDQVKSYLLTATGFDGTLAHMMTDTNVRVVCANTLQAAQNEGIKFRYKHTKNVRAKIDNAKDVISQSIKRFTDNVDAYKFLAKRRMTVLEQEQYIENVLLTNEEQTLLSKGALNGKKKAIVETVISLLDQQKGLDYVPAARGTAWQAYNAVSEYVTHNYGRSDDSRLNAQWFGESAKINQKALSLALTM